MPPPPCALPAQAAPPFHLCPCLSMPQKSRLTSIVCSNSREEASNFLKDEREAALQRFSAVSAVRGALSGTSGSHELLCGPPRAQSLAAAGAAAAAAAGAVEAGAAEAAAQAAAVTEPLSEAALSELGRALLLGEPDAVEQQGAVEQVEQGEGQAEQQEGQQME